MYFLTEYKTAVTKPGSQVEFKQDHCGEIFALLRKKGIMARADMVRTTGWSPTTVSMLVDMLVRENLVLEMGYAQTSQSGRKPINLRIHANGRQIPTFSITNSGIQYALYNLNMEVLESRFFEQNPAEIQEDAGAAYMNLIHDILENHAECYRNADTAALCICLSGIFKPGEKCFVLEPAGIAMGLQDFEKLEKELQLPLFLGTTSQAMAYAEKKHLEVSGGEIHELIYICIGETVETGIIGRNRVYYGLDNHAGQLGHISINYRGAPCRCGGRGCLEGYVNSRAILDRIAQIADFRPEGTMAGLMHADPYNLNLEMVGRAYDAGDCSVVKAINEVAQQLFTGIYNMVCATGVGRIVIGGSIVKLGQGFLQQLKELAQNAYGNHLVRGISIEYGYGKDQEHTRGIAEYYLDKRFGISAGQN